MKKIIKIVIFIEILGLLFIPIIAQALPTTLTFYHITENSEVSTAIGEAQARINVIEVIGFDQVDFRFYNLGPENMSIEGLYFDDGAFLYDIEAIIGDPNPDHQVSFLEGASPNNLPGWNQASPSFQTSANLLADSDPPVQPNGVNPGEEVTIRFNLMAGVSYDDIISNLSIGDPDLRIGIHVQGFANGESESFINNPPAPVPEPCTLFIFLGFLIVGLPFKRYFKGI